MTHLSLVGAEPSSFDALAAMPLAALDAMPAAVSVVDASARLVRFNTRAAELWGRAARLGDPETRYCGANNLFRLDGTAVPRGRTPTAQVLRTGEPARDLELELARPDGGRSVVLFNIDPLHDDEGRISGAVSCMQDITARRRADRELARSEQDLEDFFENAAVGLHLVAADGTILRANKAELDLLGYAREEYVGRPVMDFHADADVIDDILARLSRGEKLDKHPARLRAKDGSIRHVLITSNVNFKDGEFVNTRCFTVDVTDQHHADQALRESERLHRELLEALPAAIYTTDAEGRINFYNKAAVEFSGNRPQLGSDSWCVSWKLFWPDGRPLPHDQCPMAVAIKERRPIHGGVEALAERPDGTRAPFMPFATPLFDSSGEMVGAVNMLVDMTERKRAEGRQKVLIDELNHRVKNTLAAVQSIAMQTAKDSPSPEAFREGFESRLVALSRAHDLLTRSHWEGADLRELLVQELDAFAHGRVEINGPSVTLVPNAALALGMVVHELATNAAKYGSLSTPEGRLAVRWSHAPDSESGSLRFEWTESGGPTVSPPTKRGFGARLLERSIKRELGGAVDADFAPSGLRCRIDVPLAGQATLTASA